MDAPQLFLDASTASKFITFFQEFPEDDVTRFFERQQSYTVHGSMAEYLAREYYQSSIVLTRLEDKKTMARLSTLAFHKRSIGEVVRLVLSRKKPVEMYSKEEDKWKRVCKGSAGHLTELEEYLGEGTFSSLQGASIVCSIVVNGGEKALQVGLAAVDVDGGQMSMGEFVDNEKFASLEAALVQAGAQECLVNQRALQGELGSSLRKTMERCGVALSEHQKSGFKEANLSSALTMLLGEDRCRSILPLLAMKDGAAALGALIKYLKLTSQDTQTRRFQLHPFDLKDFVRLDGAALHALNVFPETMEQGGPTRSGSLYGLLNQTKTSMGARLLWRWLKQPIRDVDGLRIRHNVVQCFVEDSVARVACRDALKRMPDINRLARRFRNQRAGLKECVLTHHLVQSLPRLTESIVSIEGHEEVARYAEPLQRLTKEMGNVVGLVESTIDIQAADEMQEYMIRSEFSTKLQVLEGKRNHRLEQMRRGRSRAAQWLSIEESAIRLDSARQLGHFLRVPRKHARTVQNQSNILVLDTRKDGIKFTFAEFREHSRVYAQLSEEYNKEQVGLVDKITQVVGRYGPLLESMRDIIAELDVLLGFAHSAISAPKPFVRPVWVDKKEDTQLRGLRHPSVEAHDGVDFIPNDACFGTNSKFHIVTGPNMGGKSTYIRSVGVAILMAQVGAFVPCDEARLAPLDAILCRVGAGDHQTRGVSTFMAEMLEAASILRSATSDSLVIIDELGRGTSTYDGFGLAWSIAEHIAQSIHARCMFATHFHELTQLEQQVAEVINAHVTAHTEGGAMTLLYRVQPGPCDKSFGIHVAELANFPSVVVDAAREKVQLLEQDIRPKRTTDHEGEPHNKRVRQFVQALAHAQGEVRWLLEMQKERIGRSASSDRTMGIKQRHFLTTL